VLYTNNNKTETNTITKSGLDTHALCSQAPASLVYSAELFASQ